SSMGANVYIAAINQEKMHYIKESFLPEVNFFVSNQENLKQQISDADLIIGAVLRRGEKAPYVLTEEMLKQLTAGTVIVDVSIDQGGCFETSRPTTHSNPVYVKNGVIHYCVSNMPGAYPKASTIALTNVTIQYIQEIAGNSLDGFISDKGRIKAINVFKGKVVSTKVATDLGMQDSYEAMEDIVRAGRA
ncbi:MAG: alanine dehydrogenase, partial [Methylococcales bacterium]|nr:alanine dehydrogenase [Methylococcales bacterium]